MSRQEHRELLFSYALPQDMCSDGEDGHKCPYFCSGHNDDDPFYSSYPRCFLHKRKLKDTPEEHDACEADRAEWYTVKRPPFCVGEVIEVCSVRYVEVDDGTGE